MAEAIVPNLSACRNLGPTVYAYLFKSRGWCKQVHTGDHNVSIWIAALNMSICKMAWCQNLPVTQA